MSSNANTIHLDPEKTQGRYHVPDGARQILLIRHGSSVGPTVNTFELGELTISDPELAPEGHAQARAVAERIKDEPIAHIFVTPLQRTHQTAAPLVAQTGIKPIVVNDLREIHLGEWEHSFYEHAAAGDPLLARMFSEERWDMIPGAERSGQFAERVRRGLAEVVTHTDPGTVSVAFSHAATIGQICHMATGSRPFAFMGVENTAITRLVIRKDGGWQLRSFNDAAHLGYH